MKAVKLTPLSGRYTKRSTPERRGMNAGPRANFRSLDTKPLSSQREIGALNCPTNEPPREILKINFLFISQLSCPRTILLRAYFRGQNRRKEEKNKKKIKKKLETVEKREKNNLCTARERTEAD